MISGRAGGDPPISIVIVPRDRFSIAPRTLRSLLANTTLPYRLIYVDAGSPVDVRDELATLAKRHDFTLIRLDDYVAPNRSRNIGLREATGEFVVVAENDVLFMPGWIEPLIDCARQTGADVVSPVILIGEPRDQRIHFVGGEMIEQDGAGRGTLRDVYWHVGRRVGDVQADLRRRPSQFSELHCALIRRDLLARTGPFDEALVSCQEHIDFGLAVRRAGGRVYSEPTSQVAFYDIGLFTLADIACHGLRWGPDWVDRGADQFAQKWNVDRGCIFFETFYQWIDWHREQRQWWRSISRSAETAARLAASAPPTDADGFFAALADQGYSTKQATGIRRAYDAAEILFAGRPQGGDRGVLAHHLDTAAQLAWFAAPPAVIMAGLLHGAACCGQFPPEAGRSPGGQHEWLRSRVGDHAAAMIMAAARIPFDARDNSCDSAELDRLPVELAYVVAIRAAAELARRRAGRAIGVSATSNKELVAPGGLAERVLPRLGLDGMREALARSQGPTPAAAAPFEPARRVEPCSLKRMADPLAGIPRDAELIGIVAVKNECDIIESFVRYNLRVLDGLAAVAHGSTDGTGAILARLCDEGLPLLVVDEGGPAQLQASRMNTLLGRVRATRRPLLVFALDGDELIRAADRQALLRACAACPADRTPVLPWMTYMPTVRDDPREVDPLRRLRHRRAFEPTAFHKVVLTRHLLDDDRVCIGDGNHLLLDGGGREIESLVVRDIALAHFPVRGSDQIRAKACIGSLAVRLDRQRGAGHGHFWATVLDRLLPRIDLRTQQGLQDLTAIYSAETAAEPVLDPLPDIPYRELSYAGLTEVDGLGRLIDYMHEAVGPLTKELDGQHEAITALRTEAAQLRAANSQLAQEIVELRRSRSWRMTEPVRRGSTLIRRILGR
jgi:GT2 family glycosyltransferase